MGVIALQHPRLQAQALHSSSRGNGGSIRASALPRAPIRRPLGVFGRAGLKPAPMQQMRMSTSIGGGGGRIGAGSSGGSGGGDGGKGDDKGDSGAGGWEAVLLAAGRDASALPAALLAAAKEGKISADIIQRYLNLEQNPVFLQLLKIPGFRDRLLADEGFIVKVAIELGIGLVCKIAAEREKRRGAFKREIDFVFANVVMALIADFMLVWLPAPTLGLSGSGAAKQNAVTKFFASCPDNAFQIKPAGVEAWSVGQRVGAVARNGTKLLGVGFFASLFGVTITNALVKVRTMLDPSFSAPNPPQNVLVMSACYATYMASSSNLRYQIIAGIIEERGIEKVFAGKPGVAHLLSFIIRTGNTFLGSLLWVDYLRLLGVQKKSEE